MLTYSKSKYSKSYSSVFSNKVSSNKGFTVVELLVVISIFTVITTALVIQQSNWNDKLQLNSKLYDLALLVRQAQIYSLGVRQDTLASGDNFNLGYGIHFEASNNSSYIFFSDKNQNQKYDIGEDIQTYNLTNGITIDRFCGYLGNSSTERCGPDAGNIETLDISFYRPEPKAIITLLNNGGNTSSSVNPPAIIYLKTSEGTLASVRVETNGQISIDQ